jgi:hypothetical protein
MFNPLFHNICWMKPKGPPDLKISDEVFRVGKAVLDEYRQGNFGTLVAGRRGMNKKYSSGSVSRYIINRFSNGALWVVP